MFKFVVALPRNKSLRKARLLLFLPTLQNCGEANGGGAGGIQASPVLFLHIQASKLDLRAESNCTVRVMISARIPWTQIPLGVEAVAQFTTWSEEVSSSDV